MAHTGGLLERCALIKINGVHQLACQNLRGLGIRDRDRRPFLQGEDRTRDDPNGSTYVPSDRENSKNSDESNGNDPNEDKNIHPPPDREMAQGPVGVIDIGDIQRNAGVHQTHLHRNVGVQQNEMQNVGVHTETENAEVQENTNSPQNDHNDPQNDPITKIENTTDATEEDEHYELKEASMGSEGHEHGDNKDEYTE